MKNVYVDVILRDEHGNFLVQHHPYRPHKPWRFPGGKPEDGETLIATAAREAKEELGIEALALRYFGKQTTISDGGVEWTGYAFLCESYIGTPQVLEGAKHDGLRYITVAELKALACEPEYTFAREIAYGQAPIARVEEL